MEPQIAAVVIERGLARPSNGMPISWQRPSRSGGRSIGRSVLSSVGALCNKIINTFRAAARKFLPIGIFLCAIPLGQKLISSQSVASARKKVQDGVKKSSIMLKRVAQDTGKIRVAPATAPLSKRKPSVVTSANNKGKIFAPKPIVTSSSTSAPSIKSDLSSAYSNKINFRALDKVQKTSLIDEVFVQANIVKNKLFPEDR